MIFTLPESTIRTIRKDDPDFHITNGITMAPRAGFEISGECPNEYKKIIQQCYHNGWLKPIAYIKESDYMWEKLND
jgi:hypothetical protein